MIEFYRLPEITRIVPSVFAVLAVMLMTAALFSGLVRSRAGRRALRVLGALQMSALIAHMLLTIYLIAQVQLSVHDGFIVDSGARGPRYVVLAVITLVSVIGAAKSRHASVLVAVVPPLLTSPSIEILSGSAFPVLFDSSIFISIVYSIGVIILSQREIRAELSSASVKQAIDTLHTGVMFCETEGYILLANRQMQSLVSTLLGRGTRDGNEFYERINNGNVKNNCERLSLDGSITYRLPNGTVWMFTRTPITDGRREYIQFAASDVTERWIMTEELSAQRSALLERSGELKEAIDNAQELCREEEILRMRSRFHDVLGHRVALLLRALRENSEPDESVLSSFTVDPKTPSDRCETAAQIKEKLNALCAAFSGLGVTISIDGDFSSDVELSSFTLDIITECTTNSVRHGFASEVEVTLKETSSVYSIVVSDNGIPPKGTLREGGGITGMRQKTRKLGGTLEISTEPRFTVRVRIPFGGKL